MRSDKELLIELREENKKTYYAKVIDLKYHKKILDKRWVKKEDKKRSKEQQEMLVMLIEDLKEIDKIIEKEIKKV